MTAGKEIRRQDPEHLFGLVSDFFWEEDAAGRFTRLQGACVGTQRAISAPWRGRTPRQVGFDGDAELAWPSCELAPGPAGVFRDRVVTYRLADGTRCYFSLSGEALFDRDGRRAGSRGFGKDVTAEQAQHEELTRFRAAMDVSQDMIFIVDRATMRFVYVNQTACALAGYDRPALLAVPPHRLLMSTREQTERDYDEVIRLGDVTTETRSRTRDGVRSYVEVHRRALNLHGRWLIVSISHDISARKRAERARERIERMFAALSATNEAILRAATPDDLYQRVCSAAVDGSGLALATVLMADDSMQSLAVAGGAGLPADAIERLATSINQWLPDGAGFVGECVRSLAPCVTHDYLDDERTRHWQDMAQPIGIRSAAAIPLVRQGRALGVLLLAAERKRAFDEDSIHLLERMAENLVFALDNFEREAARRRSEDHIQYLATHDNLTDLPNRNLFNELLTVAVELSLRHRRRLALMFIDLDRFKSINDSLGHAAGDTLLKTIATRLKGCLRRSDTVARIGGDEFLLLVRRIDSGEAAARLARQLLSAMLEPVQLIGHTHRVTASIGIACCPDDAQDAADLIKKADMAMYRAKEEGKNNFQFYRPEMQTRSLERVRLEIHLRLALERAEFTLAYQARINLRTNEITGVEALLRWHSAELGDLTPNQFLPVAEETGLILPIGRWVLETACVRNVGWQQAGLAPLPVAVNLSPMQFADPQLIDHLSHALEVSGMVPELLELEISESAVTRDIGRTLDLLRRIKSLGVRIAIDNFGTSYSSLTQLRQLPVDSLKIDRSFVRELCHNAADQATARAIIGMARNLSLNVVAEGVETAEQQSYLRSEACDDIQGFYFSRPSDAVAFEQLLRSHVPGA